MVRKKKTVLRDIEYFLEGLLPFIAYIIFAGGIIILILCVNGHILTSRKKYDRQVDFYCKEDYGNEYFLVKHDNTYTCSNGDIIRYVNIYNRKETK